MEVIRAKSAGFCFGVKRAVDTVYEQVEKQMGKQIYTYGPIIHNEEVVKDMEAHGVKVLRGEEELKGLEEGLVIIRSHGVPKRICDLMDEKGIEYVDATCPFVKRIHKIVAEESKKGSRIIIIGNPDHPEVEGIRGWAGENVTVIKNAEEAEKFENITSERICIVSQTTFNYNKFKDLVEIISEKGYDISVLNTICNATRERQTEARSIAKEVDAMIVIGDKHSSNTQKLYEICSRECHNDNQCLGKILLFSWHPPDLSFISIFIKIFPECNLRRYDRTHQWNHLKYTQNSPDISYGIIRLSNNQK